VTDYPDVPYSVLELAVVGSGQSSGDALRATTDVAQAADRFGYQRLWVAEHHNFAGVASTSPPVLIAHLAANTERIRLGSGGVMLPNHAPLIVAEQFALLEALYPGRIDIGLGRAPGTDQMTAAALRRAAQSGAEPEFAREIQLVETYVSARADQGAAVAATPAPTSAPEIWVLGSSLSSAIVASALGLPYSFAHHFSGENTMDAVALYRERFQPSYVLAEPRVMVSCEVLAADTDAEAERLYRPAALSYLDLHRNIRGPMRSTEEADSYAWTEAERAFVRTRMEGAAVGSTSTAQAKLDDLAAKTGADELMLLTRAFRTEDRIDTLRRLARSN
jgi:luciferase family oxidoreductase group 1